MDAQLKRGFLEICVLSVLQKEDSYGYKIIKDLSSFIEMSESTLYPILKRLEINNCLTVYSVEHNSRLRKYYKITNTGNQKISEFLIEWKAVMEVYELIKENQKQNDKAELEENTLQEVKGGETEHE
ncbi:MAG: PadR family transcriptional regulator [Clostridiales bacterium]|nr:PadR family transcriptional regulator [Clostridiales bacterium]